ncbi:MAG TPA: GldG family protein, partial [Myxococcota bacterium]|nr:GldG family protein [Myxococcota bacterium]
MKKKNHTLIFVVGIVAIVILINLLSLKGFLRFDLTRDHKFTLSQASVDTVKNLNDTMTVSAYFTDNLPPPYAQHARYVRDLLEEYVAKSNGHFAFQFMDPAAAETEEDKAKRKETRRDIFGRPIREPTSVETELSELGLQPVEIRVIEDDQQQTKRAYMGIVIRYQEKHEVIPVVQNLSDLEKDMTSLMRKLTRVKEPKLGLIKDVAGPHIEKVSQALKQNMAVDAIDLKTEGEIPDDIDALLIVGSGEHFVETSAQKIDRFLRKGKSGAFLLDRYHIDPRSFQVQPIGPRSKTHEIFDLLKDYGLAIDSSLVADASCASLNMQENRGGFVFSLPVKYPFVPELMNLSFESPITKGLTGVILPFVSKLDIAQKAGLEVDILARSSKVSWLEKEPLDLNPRRNWGEANIEPDGPYPLLAQARGTLPEKEEKASEGDKAVPSRLVVMGSSAFMWDEFLSPANQVLALNIVDFMLADTALLEMRSREFNEAPLSADLSDAMRQAVKYGN